MSNGHILVFFALFIFTYCMNKSSGYEKKHIYRLIAIEFTMVNVELRDNCTGIDGRFSIFYHQTALSKRGLDGMAQMS